MYIFILMKRLTLNNSLKIEIDKAYEELYVSGKQTYHEFVRTICVRTGWPTQRVYPLLVPWFPDTNMFNDDSIYKKLFQFDNVLG